MRLLLALLLCLGCTSCCLAFHLLPTPSRRPTTAAATHRAAAAAASWRRSALVPPSWPLLASGGEQEDGEVEMEDDPRFYSARISRATGIDWGTDLSFRWVYVRALEPDGSAAMTGLVSKGDQLVSVNGNSCVGAPFDYVMNLFTAATGQEVDLAFFRGDTAQLRELAGGGVGAERVAITVRQPGRSEDVVLDCAAGANLRDVLVANGVNVYQSFTRWTNCKGKQLCGTCIVDVVGGGADACTIKSVDERSTLRANPATYRLSCVTNVYKDITVQIFPPIGADQWTR